MSWLFIALLNASVWFMPDDPAPLFMGLLILVVLAAEAIVLALWIGWWSLLDSRHDRVRCADASEEHTGTFGDLPHIERGRR